MSTMRYVRTHNGVKIYSLKMHNGFAGNYECYYCPSLDRTFSTIQNAKNYIDRSEVNG